MPSGEEYTRIELDPLTIKNLDFIGKIAGARAKATQLEKIVKITNKLAKMSLDAYKSKVPVDTEELRDRQLRILKQARQSSPYASIGVVDEIHVGRGRPKSAVELARMLQSGLGEHGRVLRRTRQSKAVQGYSSVARRSPTAGWINKSRQAFAQKRRVYLDSGRY